MTADMKSKNGSGNGRYWAIGIAIAAAFLLAYGYASSAREVSGAQAAASQAAAPNAGYAAAPAGANGGAGSGGTGCACGSGGAGQQTVAGSTTVTGGVQKVTIDLTTGRYSPNEITAKAGVPIELDFRGPASGCNGYVQSQDLGFSQDVSNGGTIRLPALKPGTYTWACGMNMYTGKIVVK